MYIVHVTCGLAADEIAAGQARGVKVSGETCLQYLTNTVHDLERPDFEGAATSARRRCARSTTRSSCGAALDRGVLESVSTDHCPFNSEQKALGRDDFSKIPNGLAMIQHRLVKLWDLGVESGRITPNELVDMTSTTIARRFGLARKGSIAPGMDADLVVFDPSTPFEFSTRTSHMNVDYDLFEGESSTGSVRHTLCRGTMVYDRGEIVTQPGHGRFVPRSLGAHGRRGLVNADRVLDDLRELASLTGGPDGARRVCWTDEWAKAREFLRSRLDELPVEVTVDAAGNLWAGHGRASGDGFVIVGSHVDSVPAGGWLDGALGVFTAVEALRSQAESGHAAGRACGSSTGPTRRARASAAACSARRAAPARSTRTRCATCATRTASASRTWSRATTWTSTARASRARELRGARAYIEGHIEQGPVLESKGEPAATVLGTFGVERHHAVFTGETAHAGATPMRMRRDTFMATSQAALAIREVGLSHEGGVCTIGGATSEPGVVTAVPGRTEMLLDQRHLDPDELAAMLSEAREACERAAADHGCEVELKHIWSIPPIPFDDRLIGFAREAVQAAGGKDTAIPSGPLHDAAEMARLIPTVMLFSSSSPPVSHTKEEDTPEADLRVAIDAYGRTVEATLAQRRRGRPAAARVSALQEQLAYLEASSPFYAERLRGVARAGARAADLPPPPVHHQGGAARGPAPGPAVRAAPVRAARAARARARDLGNHRRAGGRGLHPARPRGEQRGGRRGLPDRRACGRTTSSRTASTTRSTRAASPTTWRSRRAARPSCRWEPASRGGCSS